MVGRRARFQESSDINEDLQLMQRIASGDESAVSELYDRFGGLVFRGARQLLPSDAEAEDAVQEVFLRLWRTADRFDPARAKLVTWVMLLTRRHVIDRIRRAAVRPKTIEMNAINEGFGGAHESKASSVERNVQLQKCLATLPEIQRAVIERAYLQGFTLREVSIQLEMPLGTVKSALSRGLARLRANASQDLPGWAAS
jgi:RNA polymerase sigma-70 factor (ECF subfamily)|tara:strand:- start:1450 stop:2046 length:597 start_codon:yes stop_codon:yes gene_type:complete